MRGTDLWRHILRIGPRSARPIQLKHERRASGLALFVVGDDGMFDKLRKAWNLANAGHAIEVVGSREFTKLQEE